MLGFCLDDADPDFFDAEFFVGSQSHITAEHCAVFCDEEGFVLTEFLNLPLESVEVFGHYASGVLFPEVNVLNFAELLFCHFALLT